MWWSTNTHPASLTLDPGLNMLVQVDRHPLHDPAHQRVHLLFHTLHTEGASKCKKSYDASPVDSIPKHLIHHVLKALVSCCWGDVELVVQVTESTGVTQLKLIACVPEGFFHCVQPCCGGQLLQGGCWRRSRTGPIKSSVGLARSQLPISPTWRLYNESIVIERVVPLGQFVCDVENDQFSVLRHSM